MQTALPLFVPRAGQEIGNPSRHMTRLGEPKRVRTKADLQIVPGRCGINRREESQISSCSGIYKSVEAELTPASQSNARTVVSDLIKL